jgi:hypothetical protein
MKQYECRRCHYKTERVRHLIKHLKKKKECFTKFSSISQEKCIDELNLINKNTDIIPKNKCVHCSKIFSTSGNFKRHQYTCKNKQNNKIEILEKEAEETHKFQIFHNLQKFQKYQTVVRNTNNINGNITIINMNLNIQILNFDTPNREYLKSNFLRNCMRNPYQGTAEIVKELYFNDQHPENRSLIWDNLKTPIMRVFEDGKWVYKKKKIALCDAIERGYECMENRKDIDVLNDKNTYYSNLEYLTEIERKEYYSFSQKLDIAISNSDLKKNHENVDSTIIKSLCKRVMLMILTERTILKKKT